MSRPYVVVYGVDFGHTRLVELFKLADAAKPFYDWIEINCQDVCGNRLTLHQNLLEMSQEQIFNLLRRCYSPPNMRGVPALFDGAGKQYAHKKACYYFFAWMLRDAPVQRLHSLMSRAKLNAKPMPSFEVEAEVLSNMYVHYRGVLKSFEWLSIREVVVDRLEGSRRAIQGYQKEVVVRTAITSALQSYFDMNNNYGRFDSINVPGSEVRVGNETFDVSVELLAQDGSVLEKVLIPVKTRETEGGGHSHLFTRDINSAISTAKQAGNHNWVAVFIVAENWSPREQEHVVDIADFAVALKMNPGSFDTVDEDTQTKLNEFIAGVLNGTLSRK